MHLALPILSITSVRTLVCDSYETGDSSSDSFLRIAPAISCESSLWRNFVMPYGVVCILLYPVGIPIFYACLLFGARSELNPVEKCPIETHGHHGLRRSFSKKLSPNARDLLIRHDTYQGKLMDIRQEHLSHERGGDLNIPISSFRFLWRDYEPRVYWWEFLEVVRRIFFTALLAAVEPGSKLQLALAVFISLLYLSAFLQFRPFVQAEDDVVAEVAAWSVTITLFVCYMIRTETSFHRKSLQPVTALVLIVAATLPLIGVIIIVRPAIQSILGEKGEDEQQKKDASSTAANDTKTLIEINTRIEEIEDRPTKLFSIEEDDDAEAPANEDLEDTATDPSPYFSCSGFGSF